MNQRSTKHLEWARVVIPPAWMTHLGGWEMDQSHEIPSWTLNIHLFIPVLGVRGYCFRGVMSCYVHISLATWTNPKGWWMVLCVVLSLYSYNFIYTDVKYVKTYPPNIYIYIHISSSCSHRWFNVAISFMTTPPQRMCRYPPVARFPKMRSYSSIIRK